MRRHRTKAVAISSGYYIIRQRQKGREFIQESDDRWDGAREREERESKNTTFSGKLT